MEEDFQLQIERPQKEPGLSGTKPGLHGPKTDLERPKVIKRFRCKIRSRIFIFLNVYLNVKAVNKIGDGMCFNIFSNDIILDDRDMIIQNDTIFYVDVLKVDGVTFFQIRFLGIRFSLGLIAFRSSYWSQDKVSSSFLFSNLKKNIRI